MALAAVQVCGHYDTGNKILRKGKGRCPAPFKLAAQPPGNSNIRVDQGLAGHETNLRFHRKICMLRISERVEFSWSIYPLAFFAGNNHRKEARMSASEVEMLSF